MRYTATLAALVAAVAVAKEERTFAVLYFQGGGPVTEGRVDPIVNFGAPAGHVHTFQGANGISSTSTGESLKKSSCSTANIEGDMSAYWAPSLYFHDRKSNTFEKVKLFYMKVYYFFEPTDDEIKTFPTDLQILAGDASRKEPPVKPENVLLHGKKDQGGNMMPIQPIQFTCPRSKESKESGPRLYPENSKGISAGMAVVRVERNKDGQEVEVESGEGAGFPGANCDGYASPLRADIHFPSCYDPSKGLTDYKNNMAYPTLVGGKHNCPPGWIHVPHLFYELYWDTPKFADRWTPGQDAQPFCLSNGDCKGYSLHADFLAGWDEPLLQHIIDTCTAGNEGMDKCAGTKKKDPGQKCSAANPFPETIDGTLKNLPGNNAWYDFTGGGAGSGNADPQPSAQQVAQQPGVGGAKAAAEPAATPFTTVVSRVTAAPSEPSKAAPAPAPAASPAQEPSPAGTESIHRQSVKPNGFASELEGWKYAGCFKDTPDRVIRGVKFPKLDSTTNESCIKYCQAHESKFTIAAMENGVQCFCGKEVAGSEKLDEALCNSSCQGRPSTRCGGEWALTVYSTNGSIKP